MNVTEFGGLFASLTGKSEEELRNQLDQIMQDANEDEEAAKRGVSDFLESAFSAKFKSISEQQLNRGIRESRESLEKKIKTQYGIESNARGEDLIEQIVMMERQAAAKAASTNLEELSVDQLKGLPQVQEMVKPWVTKYEQVQSEFESFKTNLTRQQQANQVRDAIKREFLNLNPILPTDESKKQKAIDAFVNSFNPDQFQITDAGIKPLGENGNPLQDDKYNEVRLSDYVKANNYFDVHRADPTKASPQIASQTSGGSANASGFETRADLLKFMNDPSVPTAKKKEAYEAFQAKNK